MITVVIKGGLGNQLFQYASAYSISKRLNQSLKLDVSFYDKQSLRGYKLGQLNIDKHLITLGEDDDIWIKMYKNRAINRMVRLSSLKVMPIRNGKYLIENSDRFASHFYDIQEHEIFMNGYFQSEQYFKEFRQELIYQFTPKYSHGQEYEEILKKIKGSNSVAIHVRRGDFLKANKAKYHYLLDIHYYKKAIDIIVRNTFNPKFFCFSDDIDWVKENFFNTDDFQYVSLHTTHPDIDELMLMKHCKHIIAANSTFSWWAIWMNENEKGIHIVPEKKYGIDKMIPEGWIKI